MTGGQFGQTQQKIDRNLVLLPLPAKGRTLSPETELHDVLTYHKWARASSMALITSGMNVAVTHDAPSADDPTAADYATRNAYAYQALRKVAPVTLQRQLDNLAEKRHSAFTAWSLIKDFYVRRGHTYNAALNSSLRKLQPDTDDDMASYLAQGDDVKRHFELMNVTLEDPTLVRAIYNGLLAYDGTWQQTYRELLTTLGPEAEWSWAAAKVFFKNQDDFRKNSCGPLSTVLPLGYAPQSQLPKPRAAPSHTSFLPSPSQPLPLNPNPHNLPPPPPMGPRQYHPISGNPICPARLHDEKIHCWGCGLKGHRDYNCPTVTLDVTKRPPRAPLTRGQGSGGQDGVLGSQPRQEDPDAAASDQAA